MNAPSPSFRAELERVEEIIPTILDHLKSETYSRGQCEKALRYQIGILQEQGPTPAFGWQAQNVDYAKEVASLARRLQQKLEGAPEGTGRSLFLFALYHRKSIQPQDVDYNAVELYRTAFISRLKEMQAGSAIIREQRPGDYHTTDTTKHLCAGAAFSLMAGLRVKQRLTNNGNGPFRIITNSLYEIIAPSAVAEWRERHPEVPNLRQQCQDVLQSWRRRPKADLDRECEGLRLLWNLQE
jgi:hypothetical protein